MTESEIVSKTPREMFGPEGVLLEVIGGVKNLVRVPEDIDQIKKRANERDLLLYFVVPDKQSINWAWCMPTQKNLRDAEIGFFTNNEDNSVWIPDSYLGRFQELLGVEDETGS